MAAIACRRLTRAELAHVREIDRTERIDSLYVQHGERLEARTGDFSAPAWDPVGDGEHSIAAQQRDLEHYDDDGAVSFGAFDGNRLVGIGVVRFHVREGVAQLAYLHVTHGWRGRGVGLTLTAELERLAREAGDASMVVSATPSENTVGFYRGRGYEPTADPLPELLTREPDDVHMRKAL